MKKGASFILALSLILCLLAGCGSSEAAPEKTAEEPGTPAEEEIMMTAVEQNSIRMLNYLTALTQQINASREDPLFLEQAYSELLNNTSPNAVDENTEEMIKNLMDLLEGYRMVNTRRERMQMLFDQKKAAAMQTALGNSAAILWDAGGALNATNPVGVLSSVYGIAKDTKSAFDDAVDAAMYDEELKLLQDGWELDDEADAKLHDSRTNMFSYMLSVARENNLPDKYYLNESSVEKFVEWKNNTNPDQRLQHLESEKKNYAALGEYWLVLAETYYEVGRYQDCLDAIETYLNSGTKIFRMDYRLAETLPAAIISAAETMSGEEYAEQTKTYAEMIIENCDTSDWELRYFTAQFYVGLYGQTQNEDCLKKAYDIAKENVNHFAAEQKKLNTAYLNEVKEEPAPENEDKNLLSIFKNYFKFLESRRETELPPAHEALQLNCDLLFALAEKLNIPQEEKDSLDRILHGNGERLFLSEMIDNQYWFSESRTVVPRNVPIEYSAGKISIPAQYTYGKEQIRVTVTGADGKQEFSDWSVSKVERPKKADPASADYFESFLVTFASKGADKLNYDNAETVTVELYPADGIGAEPLTFTFNVEHSKQLGVLNKTVFTKDNNG